jgi:hypothetical protein
MSRQIHFRFVASVSLLIIGALAIIAPSVAQSAVISNGSFESGDNTGWSFSDLSVPFYPLSVTIDGNGPGFGFFSSTATNGVFSAVHGFDGEGPGTIRLFQDIGTVDAFSNLLTFDYRAAWDMLNFGAPSLSRTFTVAIYDSSTFATLASYELLKVDPGTVNLDSGNLSGIINLVSFEGQNVGVSFDFYIPENFTGPAFFQLDNVQLSSVPEPTSMAIFGLGALGLAYRARRKSSV